MKYVVIIGDGMADFPIDRLDGKTPLQAAQKPNMDLMARDGLCGSVVTVPEGFPPGSDVACMSIFGYNPARYYTGRAPIEAFGMGITMGEEDVAFRCNLVHLADGPRGMVMADYSGGHITTEEAGTLVASLNRELASTEIAFYPGISYRHIMVWRKGLWEMETTPPHDITGREILPFLPRGAGSERVQALMDASREILAGDPVNLARREAGKVPANSIWLWGQGRRAMLPSFEETHGLKGATVAAVDLVKGISKMIGFDTPMVAGATGYLDTNYAGKAEKALELLADHDVVYVHVEAPDEASHNGNLEEKIKAIETIDREVLGRILPVLEDGARCLIVTDHATPVAMRTHYGTPVPFAIYEKGHFREGSVDGYHEGIGSVEVTGEELIRLFLSRFEV
jgi:2,3-bisphosphoglycerate-independent phosphoglycerate mutase